MCVYVCMSNKELDLLACKTFVCPNLHLIDAICSKLYFSDNQVAEKTREIVVAYLKKTYHMPQFSHINKVIPAAIWVAGCLLMNEQRSFEDKLLQAEWDANRFSRYKQRRTQQEIAICANTTPITIRKMGYKIIAELNLEVPV